MATALLPAANEQQPLRVFTEKAYLDYSMYVILDRALPHIGDGLKPVQRRIIYAMSELGLNALAKYKKSARTVGDVLGKFHPHGDSACYEAMVLMAQPFSYRYPFIDGQGNWGSPDDPKSFAAMRYTEARLSPYAELLLSELEQGTVDWIPNFDGTLEEPALLPARVPNVLLNGSTGIAVGMATDIPPHNLREAVNACVHVLDNPKASLEDVCQHILAPDFPTAAEIITPKQEIIEMYRQGNGSLRMRAVFVEEDDNIVITALPHQVSGAKVMEQIAAQMREKKLPMVADLRDESDHENLTRIVIEPRSNRVDIEALMAHLFATTDLERSYRINLNMIGLDGKPKVKGLLEIIKEWLEYRTETVKRRLQHRLDKVIARLHILDGLLIAFLNIDEVIQIIRTEEQPKPVLLKRFGLTDAQAEAILELKLRHLAKLEEIKIRGEQAELAKERDNLEKTLGSAAHLKTLIRNELLADAQKYGDKRRSPLIERAAAQAMQVTEVLPTESVTVILSTMGWVRAAKGHEIDPTTLSYKAGDSFKIAALGKSNQLTTFIDSTGRTYSLPAHTLPSARGQGEPLTGKLNPPSGATFEGVLMGEPEQLLLCARRIEELNQLTATLKEKYEISIHCFQLDVTQEKDVIEKIMQLPKEWHDIDILINNAGLARGLDKLQEGHIQDWNAMIDTNVKGLLFITRQILPGMITRNTGHIINIGSIAGHEVYPKGNVYCATKYAVKALTQGLRMDLSGTKIRVTSIDPGMVQTEFSNVRFKGDAKLAAAPYKGLQPLMPEDIADAVIYSASCPPHVNISEILIMPTAQASATIVHRE